MAKERKWLNGVRKFEDTLCKIMSVVCTVWFASLIFLIVLQVFTRFVLKQALPWTDEGGRYLWATLCFLGCGTAISRGQHIEINIIGSILKDMKDDAKKRKIARFCDIVKYIITTGMGALIGYLFLTLVKGVAKTHVLSAAMHAPMSLVYGLVLFGFVGVVVHSLCRLILAIFDHESIIDPVIIGGDE